MDTKTLEHIAWAPYEDIPDPTREDWQKSYDALRELAARNPKDGRYPNTLGYLCYYGRHTGERDYAEARMWFEKGAGLRMIESTYKLADMLMNGLGGKKDPEAAFRYYVFLYHYCRNQFESGDEDSKFTDVALRMGRMYHEGVAVEKDDMEALGYLLEARFALNRRKRFRDYGDSTVEKNILSLTEECEKPDEAVRNAAAYGLGAARVFSRFINRDHCLAFDVEAAPDGDLRLEFRRRAKKKGKKPNKVLWSVPPAMKCFMTDFVVLYAQNVRELWCLAPGETVVCDEYTYETDTDTFLLTLKGELRCRIAGGDFYLPMEEFFRTGARDAENGSDGKPVQ